MLSEKNSQCAVNNNERLEAGDYSGIDALVWATGLVGKMTPQGLFWCQPVGENSLSFENGTI